MPAGPGGARDVTLHLALSGLRHVLGCAAAHPAFPADATLLSAAALREVAAEWRGVAAELAPRAAGHALAIAEAIDRLADAAERLAPYLPTPTPPEAA